MSIFKVLNVGQGDSIVVRLPKELNPDKKVIFIDLGPGSEDITREIKENEKVHIFFTHHDDDHFDGMKFFVNKMNQVEEITVPLYQNEITLIANSILNLKGIEQSRYCVEFLKILENIVNNQIFIKQLIGQKNNSTKLSFAYEGCRSFYGCMTCFNPPIEHRSLTWLNRQNDEEIKSLINEIFTEDFAKEMIRYVESEGRVLNDLENYKELNRFWFDMKNEDVLEFRHLQYIFVVQFLMNNKKLFINFNHKNTRGNLQLIYDQWIKTTHDACIVLKAELEGHTILLTGDASRKVFNRLIRNRNKNLHSDYLKIPHHGSHYNMSEKILDNIKPDAAIISHNNGCSKKGGDSHPHQKLLDWLNDRGIFIYLTNPVKKKGNIAIYKNNKFKNNGFLEVE